MPALGSPAHAVRRNLLRAWMKRPAITAARTTPQALYKAAKTLDERSGVTSSPDRLHQAYSLATPDISAENENRLRPRHRQQRRRSHEPDYPRKSNLPGIPGTACFARDQPLQRSASSHSPANQIARIARRGVFTQSGSKRELALFGLMSASTSCGRTAAQGYVREVPLPGTLRAQEYRSLSVSRCCVAGACET